MSHWLESYKQFVLAYARGKCKGSNAIENAASRGKDVLLGTHGVDMGTGAGAGGGGAALATGAGGGGAGWLPTALKKSLVSPAESPTTPKAAKVKAPLLGDDTAAELNRIEQQTARLRLVIAKKDELRELQDRLEAAQRVVRGLTDEVAEAKKFIDDPMLNFPD
jgi:hypothetical protein